MLWSFFIYFHSISKLLWNDHFKKLKIHIERRKDDVEFHKCMYVHFYPHISDRKKLWILHVWSLMRLWGWSFLKSLKFYKKILATKPELNAPHDLVHPTVRKQKSWSLSFNNTPLISQVQKYLLPPKTITTYGFHWVSTSGHSRSAY